MAAEEGIFFFFFFSFLHLEEEQTLIAPREIKALLVDHRPPSMGDALLRGTRRVNRIARNSFLLSLDQHRRCYYYYYYYFFETLIINLSVSGMIGVFSLFLGSVTKNSSNVELNMCKRVSCLVEPL